MEIPNPQQNKSEVLPSVHNLFSNTSGIDISNGFNNYMKVKASNHKVKIGVSILSDSIVIARSERTRDNTYKVTSAQRTALPPDGIMSDHFCDFLKTTISRFNHNADNADVWTTIESDSVVLRQIVIPKLPYNEIGNAVYWTFRRDVEFDENESVLDFELNGIALESGEEKISVTVCLVPKKVIAERVALFSKAGIKLSGITPSIFASRNLLRHHYLVASKSPVAWVFVGKYYSCISIYEQGNIVLTRYFKAGINDLISDLQNSQKHCSYNEAKAILEKIRISSSSPEKDSNKHEELVQNSWEHINRRIINTVEYYQSVNGSSVSEIMLSGEVVEYSELVNIFGETSNITTYVVDPESMVDWNPIDVDANHLYAEAINLSLSEATKTPNLLVAYNDKLSSKRTRKQVKVAVSIFSTVMVFLIALIGYLQIEISSKHTDIDRLTSQLESYGEILDQDTVSEIAKKVQNHRQTLKVYSKKMTGLALLNSIYTIIPNNIKLTSASIQLGQGGKRKNSKGSIHLEGIVSGDIKKHDMALGTFMIALESKPLISSVIPQNSQILNYKDKSLLEFKLKMSVTAESSLSQLSAK